MGAGTSEKWLWRRASEGPAGPQAGQRPAMCPCNKEGNTLLGCISQNSAIMPPYIDPSLLVSPCYTQLVNHVLSSPVEDRHGPSPMEGDSLDAVSVDEPWTWMGSSSTRCKRRKRGNWVCVKKRERFRGDFFAVWFSLTGGYREDQETFQRSVQWQYEKLWIQSNMQNSNSI